MNRITAAQEIIKLAKELMLVADEKADLEKTAKSVAELAREFKQKNAALLAQIDAMEKELKAKREALAQIYKDWAAKSGYKTLKASLLQQAQTCMSIGDTLEGLADDVRVQRRLSEQESYKEKYNILVSTLNEAELAKFSAILDVFFNKQITELKAGLKELDGELKEWSEGAQAISEERGLKLPKASEREAGVLGDALSSLKEMAAKLAGKITGIFSRLVDSITGNGKQLDKLAAKVEAMAAAAREAM